MNTELQQILKEKSRKMYTAATYDLRIQGDYVYETEKQPSQYEQN